MLFSLDEGCMLMWLLLVCFVLHVSVRVVVFFFFQAEDGIRDVAVTGVQTCALPISANRSFLEVSEGLEARYTGVRNWSFYARGEWSQTDGNQDEVETETDPSAPPLTPLFRDTDWHRFNQKYTVGANWYPLNRLNFGAQYYHKIHSYDYDHPIDSTVNATNSGNRYPAFLTDQRLATHDMNIRAT